MKRLTSALAALMFCASAQAQNVPLQGGPWGPGRTPMYSSSGTSQPILQDSGPAGGGQAGVGLSELLQTSRAANGVTVAPYANSGSGPLNTHGCFYDAPINNPTGFHYLCVDANAQGGGLITYGAGGGASTLPFVFNINGATFNPLTGSVINTPIAGFTVVCNPTGSSAVPSACATIPASTLPVPSASTLGGVQSYVAVSHQWISSISTLGVPVSSQPAFTDISGQATLSQLPSIANNTALGNVSGITAAPAALTATQFTTLCNVFTSSLSGCAPASSGGTTNFLRADGSWVSPSSVTPFGGFGASASIASATTTDLGTISGHFAVVSGNTTITSFGSSASATAPIYLVQFSGSLTLTYNVTSMILPGAVNYQTATGDYCFAQYLGSGNWQVLDCFRAASQPFNGAATTVQTFTSGTGATYTPTAGTVRIHVRMWAGGGGGGAQATNNGTNGNNSSFSGSAGGFTTWTAVGGNGGNAAQGTAGIGGTGGTDGTGTKVVRIAGQAGMVGYAFANQASSVGGGAFGTPNTIVMGSTATCKAGFAPGGGGTGGGTNAGSIGSGGGGGEYVEFWLLISQMGSTATYTVGAAANGGAAGTQAGCNSAPGMMIIEEFYN